MASNTSLLVADIGGTNGRLAVASLHANGEVSSIEQARSFDNNQFESLPGLVSSYLDELTGTRPESACLAIAGPNDGRRGFMINRSWQIDADKVQDQCGLREVALVNDFAALAAGVPGLPKADLSPLQTGEAGMGPCAVIGPGTGFGVAHFVSPADGAPRVTSTEGGHMALAPGNELEIELWNYLQKNVDYYCVEAVLSGGGLVRLHVFICERAGE
jgi:glucokinase